VHHDWENSHPLDLTDEGLMAELEEQDDNVVEDLALNGKKAKGAKGKS
jgi:cardiolipin synthase A/B